MRRGADCLIDHNMITWYVEMLMDKMARESVTQVVISNELQKSIFSFFGLWSAGVIICGLHV